MGGAAANMLREFGGTLAVAAWKHSAAAARATTNSPGSEFGGAFATVVWKHSAAAARSIAMNLLVRTLYSKL